MPGPVRKALDVFFTLALIVLECIAVTQSLIFYRWDFFRWYTQLSNLLMEIAACVWLFFLLSRREAPRWVVRLKYTATCCITLTFFTVFFIFIPMAGLSSWRLLLFGPRGIFTHTLCPLISILTFVLIERDQPITRHDTLLALVPTALYTLVLMPLCYFKLVEPPYPFLNVRGQGFLMTAVWLLVMFGVNYGIAWAVRRANRGKI